MEFPDLGQQCLVKSCNKLDFLPIKCDSCCKIFCGDHFKYDAHECPGGLKDNQVPVCPLCSAIIPVPKGVLPDVLVGEHIDNDCKDQRATDKRSGGKIYTNKCNVKGCKQKELIPVLCSECKLNFCLRHRHVADHECDPRKARIGSLESAPKSGDQKSSSLGSKITNYFKPAPSLVVNGASNSRGNDGARSLNGGLDTDEAIARALHESMNGSALPVASSGRHPSSSAAAGAMASSTSISNVLSSVLPSKSGTPKVPKTREEEDEMLARAIANSEREVQRNKEKCRIS